jgi:EAL domain-containing protein (putative c-di-GMP-specific phosphodiesterase class I)
MRQAIARPFDLDGLEHHCTASIGVSVLAGADTSSEDLLKRADTAMYQAKRSGRNAIRFFDPATHAAMQARVALEADLRKALPAGQFSLHYQRQADLSGATIGAEVLLRWRHPERGDVPPGQFIAVAEESDLIVQIGQWVLETACRQLAAWRDDALLGSLKLAVNVSARQFRQADFVDRVRAALDEVGVDPQRLKLELTESLVLVNVGEAAARMQALRGLGVRFAIDDFGTGQSSLAYLSRLPLDQLKIDQSFVRNVGVTANDDVIVQTIIGMARTLGIDVIAEGVETAAQRDFLERSGCRAFQGWLYGRPQPLADFERAARDAATTAAIQL